MEGIEAFYHILVEEQKKAEENLKAIEEKLAKMEDAGRSIIVKKIKGQLYYYEEWREDGKTHTKYLSSVKPGAVVRTEQELLRKEELLQQRQEQQALLECARQTIHSLFVRQGNPKEEEITFEVFWKDELTARVHAKGEGVRVSRFVTHPLKQLFFDTHFSRGKLNQILELRCFERGRPDVTELLNSLGLKEYQPLEIIKKTHGVSYDDYIWFRFPGETLTAKDVLVKE